MNKRKKTSNHHRALLFCLVFIVLMQTMKADAEEPIEIAAVFSKTGYSDIVRNNFRGVTLAVRQINEGGGISGKKIAVTEIDNKSDPLEARRIAQQIAGQNYTAVIGCAYSTYSLAMAPVLQQAQIPMISNISTSADLTKVGDYIFRACFVDTFQGSVMAGFARNHLKANTAVVMTNVESLYSIGLARIFSEEFTKSGGTVMWEAKYLKNNTDFSSALLRIKTIKPGVVFLPGYSRESSLIIRQGRKMGITVPFLGGDGWGGFMIGGFLRNVAGVNYACQHWHPDTPNPVSQQFVRQYVNTYKADIEIQGIPLAYDATMMLASAIRRAGTTNRKSIRDALAETHNFQGVTGNITLDENRNPVDKNAVIVKIENGHVNYYKTIQRNHQP